MEKKTIIFILIILLALVVGFVIGRYYSGISGLTGNVVNNGDNYSYTKAICNSNNECIDVVVSCDKGEVVSVMPQSQLIKFDEGILLNESNSEIKC